MRSKEEIVCFSAPLSRGFCFVGLTQRPKVKTVITNSVYHKYPLKACGLCISIPPSHITHQFHALMPHLFTVQSKFVLKCKTFFL